MRSQLVDEGGDVGVRAHADRRPTGRARDLRRSPCPTAPRTPDRPTSPRADGVVTTTYTDEHRRRRTYRVVATGDDGTDAELRSTSTRGAVRFRAVEPRGINGVARHDPDRIALIAGDRRMTFGELDADANRIAHVLDRRRRRPGRPGGGDAAQPAGDLRGLERRRAGGRARRARELPVADVRGRLPRRRLRCDRARATTTPTWWSPRSRSVTGLLGCVARRTTPRSGSGPATPPTDDFLGATVVTMNYTSGTTGRPKGIERVAPLPAAEYPPNALAAFWGFEPLPTCTCCAGPRTTPRRAHYAQMSLGEGGRW